MSNQKTETTNKKTPRESLVSSLLTTIARLLVICFILIVILVAVIAGASGIWLHTYNTFTTENLVAIVEAEEIKYDNDDNPYFKITYTPIERPSAFTRIFVRDEEDEDKKMLTEREEFFIHGDRFMVEAHVVNFEDWANLLGFKTIYKVSRIRGEYNSTEKERSGKRSVYDMNGGMDPVWETMEYNQEILDFLIDGVYVSGVSQSARKEEATWGIYMTEDGLIMKKYK
ncbi:hypothetical protein JW710_01930 [Candidatus Dojkabacteria bacterium]|nr:hypothetical protein [Candidatus Dojkabacteria bacterium]